MHKKIGIDIDNVISDSVQPFADFWLMNRVYGLPLGKFIVEKILLGLLSSKFRCLFSEKAKRIRDTIEKSKSNDFEVIMKTMLLNLKPMPNAKEAIGKLNKKYNIYFITTREYFFDAKKLTYKWLKKNKIKFSKNKVIFTTNKLKDIKKLGIKIIIEDHPKIPIELANGGVMVYLFDYWFNRKEELENEKIIRISNEPSYWKNIEKELL